MTDFVQAVVLGVLIGGTYALVGTGLSLIYGVMGIINFAHGALLILAAFLTYTIWHLTGLDPLATIVITTPAMFAIGWAIYNTTFRPIRAEYVGSAVLLPFGLALLLEAAMGMIWGNNVKSIRPPYADQSFVLGSFFFPKVQVFGLVLALVVLVLLVGFLKRTWSGRAIRAAATNPSGAELVGVKVSAVSAMTFAIGVAATAAGGSIIGVVFSFVPGSGAEWLLRLLAIVVLGGMGSIGGTVVAGLLLGIAESLTSRYIGLEWTTAVPYIVVFVVLLARPQGLFGARLREDVAV